EGRALPPRLAAVPGHEHGRRLRAGGEDVVLCGRDRLHRHARQPRGAPGRAAVVGAVQAVRLRPGDDAAVASGQTAHVGTQHLAHAARVGKRDAAARGRDETHAAILGGVGQPRKRGVRARVARPRPRWSSSSGCSGRGVLGRAQPELLRDRPHGGDDVGDVLVQVEPEQLGAGVHLVAVYAGRERRLLELLPHRLRLEPVEPGRPYEPAGVHEAGELVAGEQHLLQLRIARQREVLRVREHRDDELLGVALRAQDRRPVLRVLVERRVDLVVEVVQQRGRAPELLVPGVQARVEAHRRLDRARVAQQRLALRVAGERVPGPVAGDLHRGRYDTARLMQSFVIEGGRPLSGTVRAAGNKNGALPILAATILASEPVRLENVPRIRDVETMVDLLSGLGADARWTAPNEVTVDASGVGSTELDAELAREIRASFLLAGPLLARFGEVRIPPPGGDVIGRRRLDTHIHAFAELGVDVELNGAYEMRTSGLRGTRLYLDEASVMATENAIMAAVLAEGTTVVGHAACEPHIQDLCRFLVGLGARIEG